jgi:hypothetical protein
VQLEKYILQVKRERFEELCQMRKELDDNLLPTHVGNYLVESLNTNTALYQYCLTVHKKG